MAESEDDLLYASDVAELLEVGVRTVHRMAADGRLPVAARGKGLRGTLVFRRADVEQLLAAR